MEEGWYTVRYTTRGNTLSWVMMRMQLNFPFVATLCVQFALYTLRQLRLTDKILFRVCMTNRVPQQSELIDRTRAMHHWFWGVEKDSRKQVSSTTGRKKQYEKSKTEDENMKNTTQTGTG
jgi:hypothetical protein